jgi:uncharacterized protein YjcR
MARFTKEETAQKKTYAKELYIKDFSIDTIAEIIGVAASTVKRWAEDEDFETAKQSSFIAISELRKTILQSFMDLKEGRKPTIKPDEAAKYAAAFDKLSDRKKVLSYMYESFEILTDELIKDIENAKNKKDKDFALTILKRVREKTDIIIAKTTDEAFNS